MLLVPATRHRVRKLCLCRWRELHVSFQIGSILEIEPILKGKYVDVNETHFHLIFGKADWKMQIKANGQPPVAWNGRSGGLTLQPVLSLFRNKRAMPLAPQARRGTAVDKFGNWYWISHDRQRIYWQPSGTEQPSVYWEQTAVSPSKTEGSFGPVTPPQPIIAQLSGLAVTSHHYLVVGNISQGGLFVFDLHAGGAPVQLLFPAGVNFTPYDMAAAPDGGLWILDKENHAYWGLDRTFRVMGEKASLQELAPETMGIFRSVEGTAVVHPARTFPNGFPLPQQIVQNPISIVGLPDNTVLILDSPPTATASRLHHYNREQARLSKPLPLQDEVTLFITGQGITRQTLAIVGHDMAYNTQNKRLYVVEREGNQALAITLDLTSTSPTLEIEEDYFPMHYFGGRGLVAGQDSLYYDVEGGGGGNDTAVRWLKLQAITEPRYKREANLLVGSQKEIQDPVFDGKQRDCVWHRLFLDACIPAETAVTVYSRAHNDPALLDNVPFNREPDLYLRGRGAEIPFYTPFAERETLAKGMGTWELLFQQAQGRYLQIKLELRGNGRVTPQLRALRAYYPRFSYPRQYLPAVYLQDDQSAEFLERMLANMEGFYSDLEGQIAAVSTLFDPRSAPPDALDWLSGWLGLMLDPLWGRLQARRQKNALLGEQKEETSLKRVPDRRRLFIRFARKLYERRGTPDGIRFALHLLLEPCLEQLLDALKAAALNPSHPLRARLTRYGLPLPSPVMGVMDLEDLLVAYVLKRPSKIRLVESFLIRRGRARVSGYAGGETAVDSYQAAAHQFSVLIPEHLPPEEEAMATRIINLEKPAHTQFTIRHYWYGFRVGEARLGLDTTLDQTKRFVPMLLGQHDLAQGYLSATHPMNVRDRPITDRDRLGNLPPL